MNNHTLWYARPADNWNEALPLGNGKLGAMVFGGVRRERIQLNEDSLWSGGFVDRNNPDCKENRARVRQLLAEGQSVEAERLATATMTGIPDSQRCYQTLGDLHIETFCPEGDATEYYRALELQSALSTTRFAISGVTYTRDVVAAVAENVIATHLRASRRGALRFRVKLSRDRAVDRVWTEEGCAIGFAGCNGGAEGLHFSCMVRCVTDGNVQTLGEYIVIDDASEATLYLTAATSFREADSEDYCRRTLGRAIAAPFEAIMDRHLAEFRAYYDRSTLILSGDSAREALPTDQRLHLYKGDARDNGLTALYYHYGRYLLIASSRPGSLPANLQGIWCHELKPRWDSKYTININTEMNYWLAECGNLSELHQPLFDHMARMYPNGMETARKMYGTRGWMAHHNTDLWGDCAPQDTYMASTFWVMGAAWLCTHIWTHYAYTKDSVFLEKHLYLLRDACRFLLDVQVQNSDGWYVVSPTVSPENTYKHPGGSATPLCDGCVLDAQIARHVFTCCQKAYAALGKDDEILSEISVRLPLLPPNQIGADGRLMEWLAPFEEVEPGHRHISHLYALFPGQEIVAGRDGALAAAARKTLEYRLAHGGGHTGWSRAWIISFWAFLGDGAKVQENIEALLTQSTLPNLFDDHPPFQIDGNFGGPVGMLHALAQCQEGTVRLLPSLPPRWREGEVQGLRAPEGLVMDIRWAEGGLASVSVQATLDADCVLQYGEHTTALRLKQGDTVRLNAALEAV